VDACYYLGRALYATDQYHVALAPLAKALAADTVKGRAETALAQCNEALGRAEEAERGFRAAIERGDAWRQQARIAFGRFLVRQGRAREAVPVIESAMPPDDPDGLYALGQALADCDRTADAVAVLRRAKAHPAAGLLLKKLEARLARP
jgi:Tfp pilus assembly protein PilF